MGKQKEEVPNRQSQPEIIPPQEPVGPNWPLHNPEVHPGQEPAPDLAPKEIPPPPADDIHFSIPALQ